MSARPLIVLLQAQRDVRSAVVFYRREAGASTAGRFIASLERQYRFIAQNPGAGSPRYASELGIDGLRDSMVKRFPYLVFYAEFADRIEVWRVLHARRDIPAQMRD